MLFRSIELSTSIPTPIDIFMEIPVTTPDSGDVSHHPFPQEIHHFIDCILQDQETIVNLNDAMKTQEIIFAADLSAEIGKPVRLPLSVH